MKKNVAKILSFVLALALLSSAFPMAAEAAHIHDYAVIILEPEYKWINNDVHSVTEVHAHICSCGDTFKEHHDKPNAPHAPALDSAAYEGSYIGEGGKSYDTYRYTCKYCNGTYRRTMLSSSKPASVEEAE